MNAITNNYRFSFLISSFIQPSTIMVMSYPLSLSATTQLSTQNTTLVNMNKGERKLKRDDSIER